MSVTLSWSLHIVHMLKYHTVPHEYVQLCVNWKKSEWKKINSLVLGLMGNIKKREMKSKTNQKKKQNPAAACKEFHV